jgi:hypothetical protein
MPVDMVGENPRMVMTMNAFRHEWVGAMAVCVLAAGLSLGAQGAGATFKATASVKSPGKSASVPVTIRIDRFVSDADRDKVVASLKGAQGETRKTLAAMADVGYIAIGERRTPVKYAYARSTGGGRLVTVVTAQPIYYLGGAEPNAKPKEGYDLALALLVLDGQDTGDGELAPAVKLKVDAAGAIVTDDYGSEVVRLTKVAKKN